MEYGVAVCVVEWLVCSVSCCVNVVVSVRPTALQSSLWSAWEKTLTRHFAMPTGMCMQSQGHRSLHVWQACDVRGKPPVV